MPTPEMSQSDMPQPEPGRSGRHLVLLRHGKSDHPGGVTDHQRPLAARGRAEAALAGAWLRTAVPAVDAVLCSTAERTRQTLTATGIQAPATFTDDIYEASVGDILARVLTTDPRVRTLLVVGHSPGMPLTAAHLGEGLSDPARLDELLEHFPTSAIAVLHFDGEWAELGRTGAELVDFVIPRDRG